MSKRTERVGSLIRAIIADAIQSRLNDPRVPPITSITRVEISADFAVARVFVSVMATDARRQLCLRALRSAAGYLRRLLGPQLSLRKTPALDFRLDDSLRRSFETVQLIDQAMEELGQRPQWERGCVGDAPAELVERDEDEEPPASGGEDPTAADRCHREDA